MKIHVITALLIVFLLSHCTDNSEPKSPPENDSTTELLTAEQVEAMGFKTNSIKVIEQGKWHKEQFGEALISSQRIKSLTAMKGHSDMYPRFEIIRETFSDSNLASIRGGRLDETDPSVFDKSIYRGFVVKNNVWIVVADAHIFGYDELNKVLAKLKGYTKKLAEQAGDGDGE